MAQQINLFNPILLTPKRYFSAPAMAKALAAIALGTIAMCVWALMQAHDMRAQWQQSSLGRKAEREHLTMAIAHLPAQKDETALEQDLQAIQKLVAQRRQVLSEITRGAIKDGRSHSAFLRLIAQTTPDPVWLSQIRLSHGRLEMTGNTLDLAALQPWMATLIQSPLLAGQRLAAVKVERMSANNNAGAQATALQIGAGNWAFTLRSESQSTLSADGSQTEAPR